MRVCEIDPIRDARWLGLVGRHPRASVFHTPGWLEALRRTYGYEAVVVSATPPAHELTNGIVLCKVLSWLTGRRMVSLPFADHCEPLVDSPGELRCILESLRDEWKSNGWRCVEVRPTEVDLSGFPDLAQAGTFCWHRLDLQPSLDELFRAFHKDCVQRKIRRAERERLSYEEGRSERLLEEFYRLMVLTRRRHLLLPAPLAWFRNLIACMGDDLTIHVASKNGQPLSSILTLRCKTTLVYKYGCSDRQFSNLGGTQLLFWKAIQAAKRAGLREFDMGRSGWETVGLIKFKDRWGAPRSTLTYSRYGTRATVLAGFGLTTPIVGPVLRHSSDDFLGTAGSLLYRHLG